MTPYLVIGGIGVALLVFSLVVGELFDGLFDAFGSDLLSGASLAAFLGALGFVGALVFGSTGSHGWATGGRPARRAGRRRGGRAGCPAR